MDAALVRRAFQAYSTPGKASALSPASEGALQAGVNLQSFLRLVRDAGIGEGKSCMHECEGACMGPQLQHPWTQRFCMRAGLMDDQALRMVFQRSKTSHDAALTPVQVRAHARGHVWCGIASARHPHT